MVEKISACFMCGCNCGLVFTLDENYRIVKVRGDKDNPRTKGFICTKGLSLSEHIDSPYRLTKPLKREGDKFVEVSWNEAIKGVAEGLKQGFYIQFFFLECAYPMQIFQLDHVLPEPLAVEAGIVDLFLDLLVLHDALGLGIDIEHPARFQATGNLNILGIDIQHPDF